MNDKMWASFQAGLDAIDKNQFERAKVNLKEAIEFDPEDCSSAYHYLGVAYANLGQNDLAIEAWQEVTKIAPYSQIAALSHDALTVALTHMGRTTEAIEHGKQAVRIAPGDATMHLDLSIAFMRAGRTGEGVSEMEEAVFHNPESEEFKTMLKQAYDQLLQDARTKPTPVLIATVEEAVGNLAVDISNFRISTKPNQASLDILTLLNILALLDIKLNILRLVAIASRSHMKKNGQKMGGVVGGVLGLFGGPLVAVGGAAVGAKVLGHFSDDAERWESLTLKLEMLQISINNLGQVVSKEYSQSQETAMLLETGYGVKVPDADSESIATTLKNLLVREDDGCSFAILEASLDTDDYIQAIVDGHNTFHVEYREQDNRKHYEADGISLMSVLYLFQAYRNGGGNWENAIAWQDASEKMQW